MPLLAPPPPVMIIESSAAPQAVPLAVSFVSGQATCAGQGVVSVHSEVPMPATATRYDRAGGKPDVAPADIRLNFSIDASGRPHRIARDVSAPAQGASLYFDTTDIEPSFSASRFTAGQPRADCNLAYRVVAVPLETASASVLGALAANNRVGPHSDEIYRRLRPSGSTCAASNAVRPLVLVFTDPQRLRVAVGGVAWTVLNFDMSAQGKAINLRTIAAAGSATLEREGKRALGASAFVKTPRLGCLRWYTHRSDLVMPAPAHPADGAHRRDETGCPVPGSQLVAFRSRPAFPLAFSRRGVEGWAHLRFDVAPWGDVGNIEVLAAEPAQGFGDAAKASLRGAKAKAAGIAHTGCFLAVNYKLEDGEGSAAQPAAGGAD